MKLAVLLQSLRPDEHHDFEKFLQSPFFKASDQYLKFFRHLCKRHPGFEVGKADLEEAYRKCFGEGSLTDPRLYNLMSGLSRQVEQFLVVQTVMNPEGAGPSDRHDRILVEALGRRNMGAYFRQEAQRVIDAIAARPAPETDHYLALQHLHEQVYYNPDTPKGGREGSHFGKAVQHLDRYYCLANLRYASEMKARELIFGADFDMPLLKAVLEHSARPGMAASNPVWSIYFQLVNLYLAGPTDPAYRSLTAVFKANFPLLSKTDQLLLLTHLINIGISFTGRDSEVEAEVLSLYKLAIKAGLLPDRQRVTHQAFFNIAVLACRCREFSWADDFIDRFSVYVEEGNRQATVNLARANLCYFQGLLDEAQALLTAELFAVPSFELPSRALLVRVIFDRFIQLGKDYEFLTAQIRAYEKFIYNQPWKGERKAIEMNWIRFIRKLAAVKFKMVRVPEPEKESLRQSLRKLQPVASKKWLEAKIDAL
jgi:hypothetical protein